jgi:hypothetical protein
LRPEVSEDSGKEGRPRNKTLSEMNACLTPDVAANDSVAPCLRNSNQALSYDNHVVAERRRWFDRKTRAQDSRQLRCKRQRNQQEDCCTFHVLQCYPNQARHGKLIIIDFTISCVLRANPPQHNDEESSIIVRASRGVAR